MRISLFGRVLPIYLFVAALFIYPVWQHHLVAVHAQKLGNEAKARLVATPSSVPLLSVEGTPKQVVVPRLAIDLAVVNGIYDKENGGWSVAANAANYAPNTSKNNNLRNKTFIYGHATHQVFGATTQLTTGDIAYVYTTNNHVFEYKYSGKSVVKPSDVDIFEHLQGRSGLVLMTCDGTWSENRRLMYFDLVAAS